MSGKRVDTSTKKKSVAVIVSLLLVLTAVFGATIAYLTAKEDSITNTFVPAEVKLEVGESFAEGGVEKKNVVIKNIGDVDAYVRAAIVVTWQKADGTVYAKAPVLDRDYTLGLGSKWTKGSGYYYYSGVVAAETGVTENLINNCTVIGNAPAEGYTLHVEILAQAVQSSPVDAVKSAWGEGALSLVGGGANG